MNYSPKKFSRYFKQRLNDFVSDHPPNRLSGHLRDLLLEHLLEFNGAYLVNDDWIADLSALFDFLDDAHRQRKKWKKKAKKMTIEDTRPLKH